MSCVSLYSGQDIACKKHYKKYFQQVVLVNKDDVLSFVINSNDQTAKGSRKNRIRFSLKEGKTGYLFRGPENGNSFFGSYSKEIEDNIPQYLHSLQIVLMGATEEIKNISRTLDKSNYFGAAQFMDGTVEIYGFENGLVTDDYDYDLQGNGGGAFLNLISPENGLEDDPPYVYIPLDGDANTDFNNLFVDIPSVEMGSFNDDFNDDFDITI